MSVCPSVQKDLLIVWCACLFFFTVFPKVFEASRRVWANPLTSSLMSTTLVAVSCHLLPDDVYNLMNFPLST